jgi:transcriptional regulator with XRE-family HTH domain
MALHVNVNGRQYASIVTNVMGCRRMGFAEALRALMDERGISGHALARQVPCNPAYVSRLANGKQQPSRQMARRLDKVLDAGGELAALAPPRWRSLDAPDAGRRAVLAGGVVAGGLLSVGPDVRERLAWAARNPLRIDMPAVAALAAVLAGQRRADDTLGSHAVLHAVLDQLALVEDLVMQARGPVRPILVSVAQQWAEFAAWLHRNTGDQKAAWMLYAQTLEWAAELGDQTMIATVLVHKSDMAAQAGQVGSVIGLSQAAQRDNVGAAGYRALGAGLEARGYAMAGDGAAAERKLDEVHDLVTLMADQRDISPWLYWLTPTYFQNEEGIVYGYLADDSRYYQRAVTLLETGYPGLADDAKPIWAAGGLVHLVTVHARAGDIGQACSVAVQASEAVRLAGSARLAGMLTHACAGLRASYPDDPRVAELAEALR